MKREDLTGRRFGDLVAQEYVETRRSPNGSYLAMWRCTCDCGGEIVTWSSSLRRGKAKSCGCHTLKHGLHKTPTYTTWQAMLNRCYDPASPSWPSYGAKGVQVCAAWHTFGGFLSDMGVRPPGTTIDRIRNDKGYEPGNCQLATATTQARNRSNVKLTEELAVRIRADDRPQRVIAGELGVSRQTIGCVKRGVTWK